jgi:AAA ATPase domain
MAAAQFPLQPSHRGRRGSYAVGSETPLVEVLSPTVVPSATMRAVGRKAELAQLHRWLRQVLQGTRQVGFVTGEAGLGKTTLAEVAEHFVRGRDRAKSLELRAATSLSRHGYGRANTRPPGSSWPRSMVGSARALTPLTSRMPGPCWKSSVARTALDAALSWIPHLLNCTRLKITSPIHAPHLNPFSLPNG